MTPTVYLTQFPLVVNFATTGHKLQGKTVDQLVIAQWTAVRNWAYVVLSRVRELRGLFLTRPIPPNLETAPKPALLEMMERMRPRILMTKDDITVIDGELSYT